MLVALFMGFFTRGTRLNVTTGSPLCTIKQCQYLGKGYNLIMGDPNANGSDPGWQYDIFTNEWKTKGGGTVNTIQGCTYTATTSDISGGRSAQTSLSREIMFSASVGFGLVGNVAFTASNSVTSMNHSAWTESMHFEEARASCKLFYAELSDEPKAGGFSAAFEAKVRALKSDSAEIRFS